MTNALGSEQLFNEKQKYIDTSRYVVFHLDKSRKWMFKNSKATDLTTKEIVEVEILLARCIDSYNLGQKRLFDSLSNNVKDYKFNIENFTIDLSQYCRQYVPMIDEFNKKIVWINCLCEKSRRNWRKGIVQANDGGNCFFNVKINLTDNIYFELLINDSP